MVNYYSMLKVSQSASVEDVKNAINRELRLWSNRTNAPQIERRQEAERMVKLLEEAEAILLDEVQRIEYNKKLTIAPSEKRKIDDQDIAGKEDVIKEGWRLLIDDNVPDALYVATKATGKDAGNPEAWALLAQAKFRWGETEDAIYEYKRAIKLRPNEAEYYFDLGTVYESTERWKEAVENYERASKIEPKTSMYRAAIGSVCVRLQMHSDAIPILEQCVSEEPENTTYQWFLAWAYNDVCITEWPQGQDGKFYCISEEQAENSLEYLSKAKELNHDDDDLKSKINTNIQVAEWAKEKHWGRPIASTIKQGAIVGVILIATIATGPSVIIGLGIVAIWVFTGFKKGWQINKNVLKMQRAG